MPRTVNKTVQELLQEVTTKAKFADSVLALANQYGLTRRAPGRPAGTRKAKPTAPPVTRRPRVSNGADAPAEE